MECGNHSTVTEFVLLGLSNNPNLQVLLFIIFFIMYMCTLTANILLIAAVRIDRRLHNSMYFFLISLSFLDVFYTSIIAPNMLVSFLTYRTSISFTGCIIQMYLYLFVGESQCILLAFMAYDRFVAICYPLSYNMIMNKMLCVRMITASYMSGYITSSIDILFIYHLTYSGPNIINHFFCEAPSVIQLSCNYNSLEKTVAFVGGVILLIIPITLIVFSYLQIIAAIIRITGGRYNAFSKCMSHMIVIVLYYGTTIFIYMQPRRKVEAHDKMLSVFYTMVIPMLNPFIYSLRNQDVQKGMRKIWRFFYF